mmetsp:Transcript_26636/g.45239  ORF Transcript_26636/g.45239 Transcript_26636/m.45239 type:complete len:213 (-) Transcript_26636:231-869(-)
MPVRIRVQVALGDVHVAGGFPRVIIDLPHVKHVGALSDLDKGMQLGLLSGPILLLVCLAACSDDLHRLCLITPSQHLSPLRLPLLHLQQLVVFKEVLDLLLHVLWHVVQRRHVVHGRVVGDDSNQLLVVARFVLHIHEAQHAAVDHDARVQATVCARLRGGNEENVQRVPIPTQGLRNVTVVPWVIYGRVKHAVKHQLPRLLLNLIFIGGAS